MRMAKIQALSSPNAGEDVGQQEPPSLLVGTQNGAASCEDSVAFSAKQNVLSPQNPAITLLGVYPKESKTYVHINTQMFVAASFITAKLGSNRVSLKVSR